MRDALTSAGFEELTTPDEVDRILGPKNDETVLVMINSVCGCAAGSARPGVTLSAQNKVIPDHLTTVFAGQDKAAVAHLRDQYLGDVPPSSPFVALLKNGEVLGVLHRQDIEGRTPEDISTALTAAYDKACTKEGPSISSEEYEQLAHAVSCGSKIPMFGG
jgi:putative YphP/YqiW family bacilliredoxin